MTEQSTNSCIDWQGRRAEFAASALALYLERPWPGVSVERIAERIGVSYWQVYYSFDGQEDIYRAAANHLLDKVAGMIDTEARTGLTVSGTIQDYVRYAAEIVSTETYRQLLFLCLRDEHTDPWVKMAYERRIARPLRQGLQDAISKAGSRNGVDLIILHGQDHHFLTTLESILALPQLLRRGDFVEHSFEQTVSTVAKHIFAATCSFDGFEHDASAKNASLAA